MPLCRWLEACPSSRKLASANEVLAHSISGSRSLLGHKIVHQWMIFSPKVLKELRSSFCLSAINERLLKAMNPVFSSSVHICPRSDSNHKCKHLSRSSLQGLSCQNTAIKEGSATPVIAMQSRGVVSHSLGWYSSLLQLYSDSE